MIKATKWIQWTVSCSEMLPMNKCSNEARCENEREEQTTAYAI